MRRLFTVLGAIGILYFSALSRALHAESVESAQTLFDKGVAAARAERWAAARDAFERAYALSNRTVILINLAGAEARDGRLAASIRDYEVVASDSTESAAPYKVVASRALALLVPRVPHVRFRESDLATDDVVELDGVVLPRDRISGPSPVDPGDHTVVVRHGKVERARVHVSLEEGEEHEIDIVPKLALRPATAAFIAELPTAPKTPSTPAASRKAWWRSTWFWTAAGASIVATTAGLVLATRESSQTISGNVPPGIIHVQ